MDPASPPITERQEPNDWTPFSNHVEFEMADFIYKRCQMSGSNIAILMELWAAYSALRDPKDTSSSNLSPFINQREMYDKIDAIPIQGVPWQSLILSFDGLIPKNPPPWMTAEHMVWFQDPRLIFKKMLDNPDFKDSFDYALYRQYAWPTLL